MAKGKKVKGKKGKKGKKKGPPPSHDKGWDKAINNGRWERPLEALPDPAAHSSFVELREKIFSALEQLSIFWTDAVTVNEFFQDLFKVSRDKLVKVELRGARYLKKVILSPPTLAPHLKILDLSCCEWLEYVLLHMINLERLSLHQCPSLKKAILHTKQLKEIDLLKCNKLSVVVLWSDELTELALPTLDFKTVELHCPKLGKVNYIKDDPPPKEQEAINEASS
ncbi:hypothetical protein KP509_04G107000 [Ceratopteris richardii]|uniref:Uncharacterized protein n=1 Tax=Ceratopteris richardii TaxID=49495 RepID=A0A8T2V0D5_CERRI|nr:hypothetical protein KP509_04G107000 [Ceratopteris richardii]KAH7440438.1 hypothetical protein KP509_04G107000 [Ceratopteris richardii]